MSSLLSRTLVLSGYVELTNLRIRYLTVAPDPAAPGNVLPLYTTTIENILKHERRHHDLWLKKVNSFNSIVLQGAFPSQLECDRDGVATPYNGLRNDIETQNRLIDETNCQPG